MNVGQRALSVTVLGINFAPEPTGIAPYTTRLVMGLRERGHNVRVVTAFPHYPEWRVPEGFVGWTIQDVVEGLPVMRVRHYVPRRPTLGRRVVSELSFGARLLVAPWGDADVVICASPALLSTAMAAARVTLRRSNPALGVIVQDLYSAGAGEIGGPARLAVPTLSGIERWVLGRADGVSVIHERFRTRLVETLGVPQDRIDIIRNWTHLPQVPSFDRSVVRARLGWGDETVVLHTGAMGEKQGLMNVVAAGWRAQASAAPVRFVLVGQGGQRVELERHAKGCAAIDIRDPLASDDFVRALRAADLLLVNERPGVVEMAVPSKLTSYFSAGVPVLVASEKNSTTSEEIAASGAGVRVDPGDPDALVAAALRLRRDPALRAEFGSRGLAYCDRLLTEEGALDAYDAWVHRLYRRKREGAT